MDFAGAQCESLRMRWLLLIAFLLMAPVVARGQAPAEAEAYALAAKATQDGFFERAEQGWQDFLARFPASERANEAALALAQARHQQKKYGPALQVLNERLEKAGALADQFRFWRGQILLDEGKLAEADAAFAGLIEKHAESPLRLNAAVAQGLARSRREDWNAVAEALGKADGAFQMAAKGSTNIAQVARGFLLLGEAQLRRNDLPAARAALQPLAALQLPGELDWERWQTLARIELAGPTPEAAAAALTNAATQARAAKRPAQLAQTLNTEADLFKRLNQPARALAAYDAIVVAEGMPAEQKRLALFKAVELAAAQNQPAEGAARISAYLTANPQEPAGDVLNLKAGEAFLEAYRLAAVKTAGAATNHIAEARRRFDLVTQLTNSPAVGRAWLNRGWTLWDEHEATGNPQRLVEGLAAFQTATEKLAGSDEQPIARVKWADAQFKQGAFAAAATNYEAVIAGFEAAPNARTNLVAQAAEQLVRAQLAQTNFAAAEAALHRASKLFPGSASTQRSWIMIGQQAAELGDGQRAREVLKKFAEQFPESPLRADADLAYARTFAFESKWPEAIDLYGKWVAAFPGHPQAAQAQFDRAWFNDRAGLATNAHQLMTNFVAQFPTNALAPRAQNWIADFYFNQEQWNLAEQNYQRVYQNTNWAAGELACQARIMAARTAIFRQNYADARGYLTNLVVETLCAPEITAEAWFMLGDLLVEQRSNSTNVLNNFSEALQAFDRITKLFPTNRLETLAWGRIGDCHLQLASFQADSYEKATNAYFRVLQSKRDDIPVAAINQAEVGVATTLEKLAEARPRAERVGLLKQALAHHLNVVYGASPVGRRPDPFWQKQAALAAARITETVAPEAAEGLYRRLIEEIPSLKGRWEAKLQGLGGSGN